MRTSNNKINPTVKEGGRGYNNKNNVNNNNNTNNNNNKKTMNKKNCILNFGESNTEALVISKSLKFP